MKLTVTETVYDENSTEMMPLTVAGFDAGEYSFGLYSRWYLKKLANDEDCVPDVSRYVAGLIKHKLNINIYQVHDISEVETVIGCSIGEWFESIMRQEYANS